MQSICNNQKRLLILIIAEVILLISLVMVSAYLLRMQAVGQEKFKTATTLRYESYQLADQLRQSSDDLTRMVRSYAVSENSQFKEYFWDILAIRNGEKARPENYERIYWDFMTVDAPKAPFPDGEKASLEALMLMAGFTESEFLLLNQAQQNSDELVHLEEIAMNAMVGKFQDRDGNFIVTGKPDPVMARNILYGPEYHEAKRNIMVPINEFLEAIDIRTKEGVLQANAQVKFYQTALIAALGTLLINGVFLVMTTWRFHTVLVDKLQRAVKSQSRELHVRKKVERKLEQSNDQLTALSITDGLTGIANRRHFDEVFASEYLRHCRSGEKLSLILLDIDYFKPFNDFYGHVKGDECLRQVAKIISDSIVLPADIASRYGGEEFACILPETGIKGARRVARRILQQLQDTSIPHERSPEGRVSVSIGVVSSRCVHELSEEALVVRADRLLYRAKNSGRNRAEFEAEADAAKSTEGKFIRLKWQDSYCSGNETIDLQHKMIFESSNKLMETFISSDDSLLVSEAMSAFLKEMEQHFRDEEEILKDAGYSETLAHAAEHMALLNEVHQLVERFNNSQLTLEELFSFVSSELVMGHFIGEDQQFFSFINSEQNKAKQAK
ncbi:diguanylate cyclase [Vibrio sp. JC009]|uniref:diguanylate cyclase n=1 Tax=Vibrio sp. JC009 TaxID=2912314 RepID=UPI0023B1D1C8|nr:diguanylate cyclase [Vibrio sp. JC009]WED23536.1 diguanylate cyclase [Vibrio sp. JC009]